VTLKLTQPQRQALRNAQRDGGAFLAIGIRARAGGAYRRMVHRLGDLGLLTKEPPYEITAAGRQALEAGS
jgi:hypothetical protein